MSLQDVNLKDSKVRARPRAVQNAPALPMKSERGLSQPTISFTTNNAAMIGTAMLISLARPASTLIAA